MGLKKLNAAVHNRGAKIAVQVSNAGRGAGRLLKAKNEKALSHRM